MHTPKTVLVIDDDKPFRSYLQTALELSGYRVITAAGGRQGLELFKQKNPDIVLVDLQMPDMHGLEVISAFHKNSAFIPVIVISGQGLLADSIESTRRGAWYYLIKPITMDELDFAINRCLERARLLWENLMYRERLEQILHTKIRELQESRARYRRLLESVTSYIYTVTVKDGKPVEIIHSLGCEQITGHTLEEFIADPGLWFRIIHEDDRPQVYGLTQHLLSNPHNHVLEHRILHKDGSIRWVTNTLVPGWSSQALSLPQTCMADNAVHYYDGVITDITQRKEAGTQVQSLMDNMTAFRDGHLYVSR